MSIYTKVCRVCKMHKQLGIGFRYTPEGDKHYAMLESQMINNRRG